MSRVAPLAILIRDQNDRRSLPYSSLNEIGVEFPIVVVLGIDFFVNGVIQS